MPDRTKLCTDDRIRLVCVPACDLSQREDEIARGLDDAGWTANTIERILDVQPIVTISMIDEYGAPWIEIDLTNDDGEIEYHTLTILDNDSWEYAK